MDVKSLDGIKLTFPLGNTFLFEVILKYLNSSSFISFFVFVWVCGYMHICVSGIWRPEVSFLWSCLSCLFWWGAEGEAQLFPR